MLDNRDNFKATSCEDLHLRQEQGNTTFIHSDAYFALGSAKYRYAQQQLLKEFRWKKQKQKKTTTTQISTIYFRTTNNTFSGPARNAKVYFIMPNLKIQCLL